MTIENMEELWDKYPKIKYLDYLRIKHERETRTAFMVRDRVLEIPLYLPESIRGNIPNEKDIQTYIEDGYPREDATGAVNMLRVVHFYEFFETEVQKMLSG